MARRAVEREEYVDQDFLMPVGFVGHGAPTLALEKEGAVVDAWKEWGRSLLNPERGRQARPKAILVLSAHWIQAPPYLGPLNPVPLIYDFQGFPPQLTQMQYPAPQAPKLAKEILHLLTRLGLKPGTHSDRGLDHGAWVPLTHMFPRADIPVLQISIATGVPGTEHLALGHALAPLRKKGVFILGSGNITHNLRMVDFADREAPPADWAKVFDSWCAETLERFDLSALADYPNKAPEVQKAVPTDDHFTPLLVAAAAAGSEGKPKMRYPYEGFEYGTLSMRCVEFQ